MNCRELHYACAVVLWIALPQAYAQTSQIGREVAIPDHLQNGQEFRISPTNLIEFGRQLFMANWTQYPSSLARLVSEGYISQVPTDPFTNRPDSWKTVPSKPDPDKPAAGPGIYGVMSGSEATAMDGTKYSTGCVAATVI